MKKLFFLTILLVSIGLSSQAQSLNYNVSNLGSDTWKMKMYNAGSPAVTNLLLAPGASATGTISNFSFPMKWIGSSLSGCFFKEGVGIPTSATVVSFTDSCGNTHMYKALKDANGNYSLSVNLND